MRLEKAKQYHDLYKKIEEVDNTLEMLNNDEFSITKVDFNGPWRRHVYIDSFPVKIQKAVHDSLRSALQEYARELKERLETL